MQLVGDQAERGLAVIVVDRVGGGNRGNPGYRGGLEDRRRSAAYGTGCGGGAAGTGPSPSPATRPGRTAGWSAGGHGWARTLAGPLTLRISILGRRSIFRAVAEHPW